MNTPRRLILTFTNPAHNFRVQAHRTDGGLLVVKAPHPEALDTFAMASGADIGVVKAFKGSEYFISFVDKAKFSSALAGFCAGMVDAGSPKLLLPAEVAEYDDAN
jgi:hypothetical protein